MVKIDEGTGEPRPSSGAFVWDPDGCSVYLKSELDAADLTVRDLLVEPLNCVADVGADDVRDVGLDAIRDPWPTDSDGHPRDVAHGLITNPQEKGSKARAKALSTLARRARWSHTPPGALAVARSSLTSQ